MMIKINRFFVLFVFALLFLISCTTLNEVNSNLIPEKLTIISQISLQITPQKCCFSTKDQTVFVWEKNSARIHIYRQGKRINTIGGMGFDNSNFSRLVDIAVSPDGNLLALDGFQEKIKKFDTDGKWLADFRLTKLSQPILFDISGDDTIYIYDDNRKEIVVHNSLTGEETFSFGKFMFEHPTQLSVSRNNVLVYEKESDVTHIFDILGQFENDISGNIQFDGNQHFALRKFYLENLNGGKKLAISPQAWKGFQIQSGVVVLYSENKVLIDKIDYAKK